MSEELIDKEREYFVRLEYERKKKLADEKGAKEDQAVLARNLKAFR